MFTGPRSARLSTSKARSPRTRATAVNLEKLLSSSSFSPNQGGNHVKLNDSPRQFVANGVVYPLGNVEPNIIGKEGDTYAF